MQKYSKFILIFNFLLSYFFIVFPFPFLSIERNFLYEPVREIYINYIVMPEYRFHKCILYLPCEEPFPRFRGKTKLNENGQEYRIKDFVIDSTNNIVDGERLDNLNKGLKDAQRLYYYVITSSADEKALNFFPGVILILLFILSQWLNWKYRFLISGKLYK